LSTSWIEVSAAADGERENMRRETWLLGLDSEPVGWAHMPCLELKKKIFKKSRFVIKKSKENLKHQLADIRSHCTVLKLLLRNLLFLNFTFNICLTLLCWYNFKLKIFKNSLMSDVS
jgi:hypothetical protein